MGSLSIRLIAPKRAVKGRILSSRNNDILEENVDIFAPGDSVMMGSPLSQCYYVRNSDMAYAAVIVTGP